MNEQVITYVWCIVGIALSIILPILRSMLPKPPKPPVFDAQGNPIGGAAASGAWSTIKPYVIVGLFSAATAILIVAFAGDNLKTWGSALLAGYAWDSTLQRISQPQG